MEIPNFKEKAISSTALKEAKKSIRDLIWYYNKPKDKKTHFDFGNAIELYIIDQESFKKEVSILDESKRPFPDNNYTNRANKVWKDNFYEENEDKYIINATGADSFETILEIKAMLDKHPAIDMLFDKDNNYQKPFEWICPVSGFKRYARTDLFNKQKNRIIDIKTDSDGDFTKALRNFDYFLQAWDQVQGALLSGEMDQVDEYFWFVISKKAPYFIDFYQFDLTAAFPVETSYAFVLDRLKRELNEDSNAMVWHDQPIQKVKVPGYYK
jgi:hypothetical protein